MGDRNDVARGYDRIAHLYDVDMARNMPFDDVSLYAALVAAAPGPSLEIGCGNGRILLDLCARGADVVGVDGSTRMLAALLAKAGARGLCPAVARMDARQLGFKPVFSLALCPYSLITYMVEAGDAARLLDQVSRALEPGGRIVLDAFIPRADAQAAQAFVVDYRRPFDGAMLVRSKRITPIAAGINRIERRYDVVDATAPLQRIETTEEVRLFSPEALLALLGECGYAVEQCWWDYAAGARAPDTRFFTVIARP